MSPLEEVSSVGGCGTCKPNLRAGVEAKSEKR